MSAVATGWAWQVELPTDGPQSQMALRIVLVKLADQANDEGQCWPAWRSLSRACCMGRSTLALALRALEDAGLIRREARHREGKQTSSIFHLELPGQGPESGRVGVQNLDGGGPESGPRLTAQLNRTVGSDDPTGAADDSAPQGGVASIMQRQLFTALVDACDLVVDELPRAARSAANKAAAELAAIGATCDEVGVRTVVYRDVFPRCAVTPTAIARHWAEIRPETPRAEGAQAARPWDALAWVRKTGWMLPDYVFEEMLLERDVPDEEAERCRGLRESLAS